MKWQENSQQKAEVVGKVWNNIQLAIFKNQSLATPIS